MTVNLVGNWDIAGEPKYASKYVEVDYNNEKYTVSLDWRIRLHEDGSTECGWMMDYISRYEGNWNTETPDLGVHSTPNTLLVAALEVLPTIVWTPYISRHDVVSKEPEVD